MLLASRVIPQLEIEANASLVPAATGAPFIKWPLVGVAAIVLTRNVFEAVVVALHIFSLLKWVALQTVPLVLAKLKFIH